MPETLLRTKLFVPPLRPNLVHRPELIGRLNQGLQLGHKLTLISAPAGFGKTTLVCEWVANNERPAAWLSLDEGDNDPTRFLVYLVAALQTLALSGVEEIEESIGERVLAVLQSPQPPPTESVLTTLLNEITTIPDYFVLVLDDYHVVDAKSIDDALTFLLEHQPPQMHLVIASREDPNLPLARMRVRGQLTELRVKELRFTSSEAAGFLNQAMDLDLSAEEIAALETRTEGWIAGLQMAALSMQGRDDTAAFIQAFAGSHHFVFDYLVGEVLGRQPEHVRSFLQQTSILDRLSGPLCETVTGQQDGKGTLQTLEQDNLFIIPLDDKRQWYRYHHLFADVLQARLMEEQPDQVSALHGRASEWYEDNGSPADAIRHALAAGDFERAAGLVELAWPEMDWSFQSDAWLSWVQAFPDGRAPVQVTSGGGTSPLWGPDGRELFYRVGSAVWSVEVDLEGGFRMGEHEELFDGPYDSSLFGAAYSVHPSGESFAMTRVGSWGGRLVVVQNFAEELRSLAPGSGR